MPRCSGSHTTLPASRRWISCAVWVFPPPNGPLIHTSMPGPYPRRNLLGDGLADGGDDLGGPAGQGLAGGGVVGVAVDEADRVVVQDGGGELVDPLLDRAADPAAVLAAGGGERFGGDAAAEVVDVDDLRRVPARRGRGGVDARAGLAVERTQPVRACGRDPAVGQLAGDGQGLGADRAGEDPRGRRGGRVQAGYVVELAVEGDRVSPAVSRAVSPGGQRPD